MTEIEKFVNAGMAAQAAVDEHGPTAYIVGLVREFPCLNRKLGPLWHPKKFDADHFHGMIGRWSHGEQLCALFVLNVWNPSYAQEKGWTFDLFDFAGIADAGNKQPVMSWLQSPYWP